MAAVRHTFLSMLTSRSRLRACSVFLLLLCAPNLFAQTIQHQLEADQRFRAAIHSGALPAQPAPADEVGAALHDIARKQIALHSENLSPVDRRAIVEELLSMRRDLLSKTKDDARRALWLIDQAECLYFDVLEGDGLRLTALFGRPPHQQLQRAKAASAELHDSTWQAERHLDQLLRDIESEPDFASNHALQRLRADIAQRDRDRRLAFLRPVAAVLFAEIIHPGADERAALYKLAAQLLPSVAERLEGSTAYAARVHAGLALARLGRAEEAAGQLAHVAADASASPPAVFAARMAGVVNLAVNSDATAALESLRHLETQLPIGQAHTALFNLIIADQRFTLLHQRAMNANANERASLIAQALHAYTNLLDRNLSVPRQSLRAIVLDRLADVPVEFRSSRSAVLAVAEAKRLAEDASTRRQAIIALEQAVADSSLDGSLHAAALDILAGALHDHGQWLFASQRFIELAERHPTDPLAESAIERGVALAERLYREAPHDQQHRQALQRGLNLLLTKYPNLPTIDRWRYVAGEIALQEQRYDEAVAHFNQVTPDASFWPEAQFMQAGAALARMQSADESARAQLSQQLLTTIDRVRPTIESALSGRHAERAAEINRLLALLRIYKAQAQLAQNLPQRALETLNGLEDSDPLDGQVIGEALKVRIDAHRAMRQPQDVMIDVRRFLETSPEEAGPVLGSMLAGLLRDVEGLIAQAQQTRADELATHTILPLAQELDRWLHTRGLLDSAHAHLTTHLADAYRNARQFERALTLYEQLLRANPEALELLRGRAECLFHLGGETRLAEAMTIYKRIAAAGADHAGDDYWLAQLRMLQILDAVNRHAEQIAPRIERLRQHDATFGGERFRSGFEQLRNKHAR